MEETTIPLDSEVWFQGGKRNKGNDELQKDK